MAFLECYFDESGSDDGSPILCVAGYLFEKDERKKLDFGWKAVLDQYSLPFFRMSACAHNQKPFKHLSRDECIEAEKAMIRLINNHATLGVAVTVNAADYETWFDGHGRILAGDAYTRCPTSPPRTGCRYFVTRTT